MNNRNFFKLSLRYLEKLNAIAIITHFQPTVNQHKRPIILKLIDISNYHWDKKDMKQIRLMAFDILVNILQKALEGVSDCRISIFLTRKCPKNSRTKYFHSVCVAFSPWMIYGIFAVLKIFFKFRSAINLFLISRRLHSRFLRKLDHLLKSFSYIETENPAECKIFKKWFTKWNFSPFYIRTPHSKRIKEEQELYDMSRTEYLICI